MVEEAYHRLFHVRYSPGFNKIFTSKGPGKIFNFSSEVKARLRWELGIDQSTSQTGLFLRSVPDVYNEDGSCRSEYAIMIDIKNKGLPSVELYIQLLREFMINNFDGMRFDRVIMEVPIENASQRHSAVVLEMLRGALKMFQNDVPAFAEAEFGAFPPQTWRKHFLKDEAYKGRRQKKDLVKESAAEEVLKRYFKFKGYYNWSLNKSSYVPDSFDAVGILEGGLCEMFYKCNPSIRRVTSAMFGAPNLTYEHEWTTIEKSNDCLEDFVQDYVDPDLVLERELALFVYDNKIENLDTILRRVAGSTNKIAVIVFLTPKYNKVIKWELNLSKGSDEVYAAIVYRRNISPKVESSDRFTDYIEMSTLFDIENSDDNDFDDLGD